MIWKKQLLSYKTQLIFGLLASVITLICLPIVVSSFERDSLNGFIITGIIILFQGLVNAFCCSGFYGLVSFFPMEQIIALSTGQGISGILMNVIGYIILVSINTGKEDEDNKYGAIIFFSISGLILLICFVLLLFAFKTEYFEYYLSQTKDFNKNGAKIENVGGEGIITRSTGGDQSEAPLVKSESNDNEINFFGLFKLLYDIDLLSCYIYIVTFTLFPTVSNAFIS